MTKHRTARLVMGLLVTMAGCVIGKSSLGETSPDDESEAGGSDSGDTAPSDTEPGNTSIDPGTSSASGDSGGGGGGGHNAACSSPAPIPLPALPAINTLPSGAPAFTAWESLTADCDALIGIASACEGGCPGSDQCIGNGHGVCATGDVDIWCDGDGEATGFGEECFVCLSAAQHARGCCVFPDAFDCRTWPFAGTSGRDMICAVHEDCQMGLVCSSPSTTATGYGVCRCPEDLGTDVDLSGCFDYD
jgi:hypothetical protein